MKILTISGFAQDYKLISNILAYPSKALNYQNKNIEQLKRELKDACFDYVIGWSLGGQIALSLSPYMSIKKLILISVPYKFINDNEYNLGVTRENFNNFTFLLHNDFNKLLNDFRYLITHGDCKQKQMINFLETQQVDIKFDNLTYWLEFLKEFDANNINLSYIKDALLIYGKKDQIVKFAQAELLAQKFNNVQIELFSLAAHLPFLHYKEKFNQLVFTK